MVCNLLLVDHDRLADRRSDSGAHSSRRFGHRLGVLALHVEGDGGGGGGQQVGAWCIARKGGHGGRRREGRRRMGRSEMGDAAGVAASLAASLAGCRSA